jgi:Spy/CpxP family protein refolding chaperone
MLKRSTVALSLAALLAGSGAVIAPHAFAQTAAAPAPHAHGMGRLQQKLGLTDDQVNAIKTAYQNHRDEQRQVWTALRTAQGDLRKLALEGGDAAAIQAKSAEVQQLLGQTVAIRVKVLQEIGPSLTPEQRAKFASFAMAGPRHHRGGKPAQS